MRFKFLILSDVTPGEAGRAPVHHSDTQRRAGRAPLGESTLGTTQHRQGHHPARCARRRLHLLVELEHGRCRGPGSMNATVTNKVPIELCFENPRVGSSILHLVARGCPIKLDGCPL